MWGEVCHSQAPALKVAQVMALGLVRMWDMGIWSGKKAAQMCRTCGSIGGAIEVPQVMAWSFYVGHDDLVDGTFKVIPRLCSDVLCGT